MAFNRNPELVDSSVPFPTNGNGFINTDSFNSSSGFKEFDEGLSYMFDNYSSVSGNSDYFSRQGGLDISPSSISSNVQDSPSDDYMSYLQGLFSSLGQENDLNRRFNEEQARINREFNRLEAEKARAFNSAEAEKSRQWSKEMSDTAYQRAVLDLQMAGLNPILAYQQGSASSPTSSSASSSPASGQNASYNVGGGDTFSDLLNSFANLLSGAGSIFSIFSKSLPVKSSVGKIGFR